MKRPTESSLDLCSEIFPNLGTTDTATEISTGDGSCIIRVKGRSRIRFIVPSKQNLRSERQVVTKLHVRIHFGVDSVYDASLYVVNSRNDVLEEKVVNVIRWAERKGIALNRSVVEPSSPCAQPASMPIVLT